MVIGCLPSVVAKLLNWCVAYKLCKLLPGGAYVKTPNGVTFFGKAMDEELAKLDTAQQHSNEDGEEF